MVSERASLPRFARRAEFIGDHGEFAVEVAPAWGAPLEPLVLAMFGDASTPQSAAVREIARRLEQRDEARRGVVSVMSSSRDEGKSTLTVQLAIALSESQRMRVLVIEAGASHPSLGRLLGFEPKQAGFLAHVARQQHGSREPLRIAALGATLHVIANASPDADDSLVCRSRQLPAAIASLRAIYDIVLIDGPATGMHPANARAIARSSDGVILAARAGVSRKSALHQAVDTIGTERLLGVVLCGTRSLD